MCLRVLYFIGPHPSHYYLRPQIGTSLGLAITSSIATSISEKYNAIHPSLPADSPEVLMAGFRAAGWTCFAAAALSLTIGVFGLRGMGVVGQQKKAQDSTDSICVDDPPTASITSAVGDNIKMSSVKADITA